MYMTNFVVLGYADRFAWSLLQASVIALAALLLLSFTWRIQPKSRVTLACTALILMTLVPTTAFLKDGWWSIGSLVTAQSSQSSVQLAQTGTGEASQDQAAVTSDAADMQPTDSTWWAATQAALAGTFTSESRENDALGSATSGQDATATTEELKTKQGSAPTSGNIGWGALALIGCGVCITIGFSRLLIGLWTVHRLRKSSPRIVDRQLEALLCEIESAAGIRCVVTACENTQINTAAVVGWRRPTLLLPADWRSWSGHELRAIVSHELAHVQRQDFLTTVIAQAAVALHLYNPLAHLLFRQLRLSQELAADALAASLAGGRQDYTQVLAAFALRQAPDRSGHRIAFPAAAQAFLPTRHMFVRRLEMLRNLPGSSKAGGWLSLAATLTLAAVSFFASGLRPSTLIAQEDPTRLTSTMNASGGQPSADSRELASYIPDSVTLAVVHVDMQKVLASEFGKALVEQEIPKETADFGPMMKLSEIESGMIVYLSSGERLEEPLAIIRQTVPFTEEQKSTVANYRILDERTLVYHPKEAIRDIIGQVESSGTWAKLLGEQAEASIRFAGQMQGLRDELTKNTMRTGGPALVLLPLWEKVDSMSIGIKLGDTATLDATLRSDSAKEVAATTQALLTLGKNYVQVLPRAIGANGDVAAQAMAGALSQKAVTALDTAEITASEGRVDIAIEVANASNTLLTFALPAIKSARIAAGRAKSINNLKQIALAMHNYAAAYKRLPAAIIYDRESGVPRSWRVEMLPFIERSDLYEQYRKDEPWDSPANLKVLNQMPEVFTAPGAPEGNKTTYLAIVSEDGGLTPRKDGSAPRFADVTDGLSNTVFFAETKQLVPWTQPVDATDTQTIPQQGSFRTTEPGTVVAMGDGSVHFISKSVDSKVWAALLTRSGGEVADFNRPVPTNRPRGR